MLQCKLHLICIHAIPEGMMLKDCECGEYIRTNCNLGKQCKNNGNGVSSKTFIKTTKRGEQASSWLSVTCAVRIPRALADSEISHLMQSAAFRAIFLDRLSGQNIIPMAMDVASVDLGRGIQKHIENLPSLVTMVLRIDAMIPGAKTISERRTKLLLGALRRILDQSLIGITMTDKLEWSDTLVCTIQLRIKGRERILDEIATASIAKIQSQTFVKQVIAQIAKAESAIEDKVFFASLKFSHPQFARVSVLSLSQLSGEDEEDESVLNDTESSVMWFVGIAFCVYVGSEYRRRQRYQHKYKYVSNFERAINDDV